MISHMNRSLAALRKADPARCGVALCLCAPPFTPECQVSADRISQREQISCEQELEIYTAESGLHFDTEQTLPGVVSHCNVLMTVY